MMRLNSTIALTIILLASMLVVGTISGVWGFSFGRTALKGVTQPAISPVLGGAANRSKPQQATFVQEEDILEQVKARTSSITKR